MWHMALLFLFYLGLLPPLRKHSFLAAIELQGQPGIKQGGSWLEVGCRWARPRCIAAVLRAWLAGWGHGVGLLSCMLTCPRDMHFLLLSLMQSRNWAFRSISVLIFKRNDAIAPVCSFPLNTAHLLAATQVSLPHFPSPIAPLQGWERRKGCLGTELPCGPSAKCSG